MNDPRDVDPQETQEWLESLESVLRVHGPERAHQLLESLIDAARRHGAHLPFKQTTAYLNTIPVHDAFFYDHCVGVLDGNKHRGKARKDHHQSHPRK